MSRRPQLKLKEIDALFEQGLLHCTLCREVKPIDQFCKNPTFRHGYRYQCKDCKVWEKQWRGMLTLEEYKHVKATRKVCEMCGHAGSDDNVLCIDHCHNKNVFRGILCNRCNSVLGYAQDKIQVLEAAIDYLRKHQ